MVHAAHRHERDHVGRAHPRVTTFVLGHVDPLDGDGRPGQRAAPDRVGVAQHGRVEPVVVGVGLGVDDASARHVQRLDDRVDDVRAPALAEVRHHAVELASVIASA